MKKTVRKKTNRRRDTCNPPSTVCGEELQHEPVEMPAMSVEAVIPLLKEQGATASLAEMRRFVEILDRSIRQREVVARQWARITDKCDIVSLIHESIQNRQNDEAIWRCFLAAHFGRPSARGIEQVQSAARFLRAFRDKPFWTWKRVVSAPDALNEWLHECTGELATLAYGNHRKYESQKPELIWTVMESFISLANEHGSPSRLIATQATDDGDRFDELYRRLRLVNRFGRTGRFDFLVLLLDLGLISTAPKSCYLRGATGPLKGARRLWGRSTPTVHDETAAELAIQLGVSPIVLEDALCNWQK